MDFQFCTLSLRRPQLLLWYYFTDFSRGQRVFPHSESPPQGPSRAYHLGKHFLCICLLFAWWGNWSLFVLWGGGCQGHPSFLRRAAFQVISNIFDFFVWSGEPLLLLKHIFGRKLKNDFIIVSVVEGKIGRERERERRYKCILQMQTFLKICTSYRNNMSLVPDCPLVCGWTGLKLLPEMWLKNLNATKAFIWFCPRRNWSRKPTKCLWFPPTGKKVVFYSAVFRKKNVFQRVCDECGWSLPL